VAGVATILAALFACADTALTSLGAARLSALVREAPPTYARALEAAARHRARLQARYLAGRVVATSAAVSGAGLAAWRIGTSPGAALALLALAVLALAVIVECAAAIGRKAADSVVPIAARWLRPLDLALAPVALVTRAAARLLPLRGRRVDPRLTETEVEIMVDQGERSGALEQEPAEMIRNVLELKELSARDVMVPRTRVIAIKVDTPLDEVLAKVTETGHSRYPVFRSDLDDVFGLLYTKDLFRVVRSSWRPPPSSLVDSGEDESPISSLRCALLLDIVRQPIKMVPESQPLPSLLKQMRNDRQHLAVVVDEFGGTSGIVTLEDVLESIVGDIQDESDQEEAPIVELSPGRLVADASVLVCDLAAYLGTDLEADGHEYASLGAMITDKLGHVPRAGTVVPAFGLRFTVRESDEKHISKVEVQRAAEEQQAG
jgi:CBS domain containing-hemolysin-like protein